MQLNIHLTSGHKESGKLMLWAKGPATTVENPDITAANALRRVRAKVGTLKVKAKVDFMDTQIINKKDGTQKVLEKERRDPRGKERVSKGTVGIVASPATDPVIAGQSRKSPLRLRPKQSR